MYSFMFPHIDPVAFEIGPLGVRWYSLAYIFGLAIGIWYLHYLSKKIKLKLSEEFLDDLFTYIVLGIIIGGRLAFVIFYNASWYVQQPMEILKIWKGGLSFHGGLVGLCIATFKACRRHQVNTSQILDLVACAAPIGLFLGRIANFINGELFGRPTSVVWGMIFPNGGPVARHPSQIYEALLEGLVLFVIMNFLFFRAHLYKREGFLGSVFIIVYAVFRIFVEFFREADPSVGYILGYVTMGQVISFVMLMVGVMLLVIKKRKDVSRRG